MIVHSFSFKTILLLCCVSFSMYGVSNADFYNEKIGVQGGMIKGIPAVFKCADKEASQTWQMYEATLLFFKDQKASTSERFSKTFENGTSIMKIDPVSLSDAGVYKCHQMSDPTNGTKVTNLVVNKIPDYSSEITTNAVKNGDVTSVASCSALNSKPASSITFEDENGQEINSLEEENTFTDEQTSLSNTTKVLRLEWDLSMTGKSYYCVVKHVNVEEPIKTKLISSINVLYEPTIKIMAENITLHVGDPFTASCEVDGNPTPELSWSFEPDHVEPDQDTPIPSNFKTELTEDGKKLIITTDSLLTSDNGTFVCRGSESSHYASVNSSISLAVYQLPPTTVPATTTPTSTQAPKVQHEPSTGGMSPVSIATLVAALCFVTIVAVIALVRHFVTHKGEYYTNESKADQTESGESLQGGTESDNETDAELLQSRKPEHFV